MLKMSNVFKMEILLRLTHMAQLYWKLLIRHVDGWQPSDRVSVKNRPSWRAQPLLMKPRTTFSINGAEPRTLKSLRLSRLSEEWDFKSDNSVFVLPNLHHKAFTFAVPARVFSSGCKKSHSKNNRMRTGVKKSGGNVWRTGRRQ